MTDHEMTDRTPGADLIPELRLALAEAEPSPTAPDLVTRMLRSTLATRPAGRPVEVVAAISGFEVFGRMVAHWDEVLAGVGDDGWRKPTIRGLAVQELVGHLIGVEEAFAATLSGGPSAADDDHVASTQPAALAQTGIAPSETLRRWAVARDRTAGILATMDLGPRASEVVSFHTVVLPLVCCWWCGRSRCGPTPRTWPGPSAGPSGIRAPRSSTGWPCSPPPSSRSPRPATAGPSPRSRSGWS